MAGWLQGLKVTRDRFAAALKSVFAPGKPSAETLDELMDLLVTGDVPVKVAARLTEEVGRSSRKGETPREACRRVMLDAMPEAAAPPDWGAPESPQVVLLVGINGSGKTTTAAKLARKAARDGFSPLLGAADTFRAAGSRQLELWGERVGCDVVAGATGADAAAAAYDAVAAAVARGRTPVFIDTAGRMHTREPLMRELAKLRGAVAKRLPGAPHHTWAVLDGMLGQNALLQAKRFHETTPLSGLVVTKLDGSSKAGFLLGVKEELGVPIFYAGLGEGEDDLAPFDPAAFVDALLGGAAEDGA